MPAATRSPHPTAIARIRRDLPSVKSPALPEQISTAPAAIAKPAKQYTELRARATEGAKQVVALEATRHAAIDADRQAHADAMRDGKPDPGTKNADALDAKVATATRELDGLVDATADTWREVKAAVVEHSSTWAEKVRTAQAKDVAEGVAGLDTAKQAADRVAGHRGVLDYIDKANQAAAGVGVGGTTVQRRWPPAPITVSTMINGTHDAGQVLGQVRRYLDGAE